MNNERDDLVSKTYRELSNDRAPDHLNERILRKAAADAEQGSSGGWRFALWMKPVAWAATIGLSLAIVLEMTQVPTSDPAASAPAVARQSAATGALEQAVSTTDDELKRAETMARERTGSNQAAPAESARSQKAAPRPALAATPLADNDTDTDTAIMASEAKEKAEDSAMVASDSPAARKLSADRAVAGQVAEAEAEVREDHAIEAVSSFAMSPLTMESDSTPKCDASSRETAREWRECIETLRAAGATKAADLETEAYIFEFPDEPLPGK